MRLMKLTAILALSAGICAAADLRLGIIGTDTSHVVAFTSILNNENSPDHLPGARVVAAYKGGSKDLKDSYSRVDKFAEELRTKWNVEFFNDIPSMCKKVDAILLESVDGRVHLDQFKQTLAAKKPVFIDKPVASTLEDAREIARLAKEAGVQWFSSSSLRFGEIGTTMKFPDANGVTTWGPGPTEPHHQLELSFYAIHPVEMLFTLMGTGVEEVSMISTPDSDVVVGKWKGGRIGEVRALRSSSEYGAVVFRPKAVVQSRPKAAAGYRPLLVEVIKFFQTGQAPVPNEETMELFAFMDAAQRSKAAGGAPTKLR
jgi:hypothetical protein